MDTSSFRDAVDSRLLAVGQHLRQREQHRLKLSSCSVVAYKPEAAGAEMTRLLDGMRQEEALALSDLVLLRDDVAAYCRGTGKGDSDLAVVDAFHALQSAKTIVADCSDSKHSYAVVSRAGDGTVVRNSIHDVRFFIELGTRSYQVLELVLDLLQFWEIFLRYHTSLDLKEFSTHVREGLVGRVTDNVLYQAITRRLVPVSEPVPASASAEVLQAEIRQRLGNVAFYIEEREILRPGLAKYTGRTFCDPSNENAKRDRTRILNVETSLLHELVHLADTVQKWLDKQGRASELVVVERLRPYRIGANLVNVLKHGVRGRSQDCAVIELDVLIWARAGDVASPDDTLQDVVALVNYGGDLFQPSQIIEDSCQVWELFLRHHLPLSLTEFRVRLGRILLSKKGLSTYSAPIPAGLDVWAQQEADRRKRLDLK